MTQTSDTTEHQLPPLPTPGTSSELYDNTGASQGLIASVWGKGKDLFDILDNSRAAELAEGSRAMIGLNRIISELERAIDRAKKIGSRAYILDMDGNRSAWSISLDVAIAYAAEMVGVLQEAILDIKQHHDLRVIKPSLMEIAIEMMCMDHAEQMEKWRPPSAIIELPKNTYVSNGWPQARTSSKATS